MLRIIFALAMAMACISACTSSSVLPVGPDTYTISTTNEISPALAKKNAHQDTEQYCSSQGKQMMPMQTQSGSHRDSFGDNIATYDFTFRCLAAGDPDLGRPELKDPTTNINVNENVKISDETTNSGDKDFDLYTELQKLDDLRQRGILTDEEFQEQKRKLLEKD